MKNTPKEKQEEKNRKEWKNLGKKIWALLNSENLRKSNSHPHPHPHPSTNHHILSPVPKKIKRTPKKKKEGRKKEKKSEKENKKGKKR